MPWAGGNLRARSAVLRRPPLFADSGGSEVREHVQSGVRPSWYSRSAVRSGAGARAVRHRGRGHPHRARRRPVVRLPPWDAGRPAIRSGYSGVHGGIRLRARLPCWNGRTAHCPFRAVSLDAPRGRHIPGLSAGGRQGIHRERGSLLQVHRVLEGLRGRRERREALQVLQGVQQHLPSHVRERMRPLASGREGPTASSEPGVQGLLLAPVRLRLPGGGHLLEHGPDAVLGEPVFRHHV